MNSTLSFRERLYRPICHTSGERSWR